MSLHVILSEPGGNDEIEARLAARNLVDLGFPIHSDPEYKLLLQLKGTPTQEAPLYVRSNMEASKFESGTATPYTDYEMIQPALAVITQAGDVLQVWSWLTGILKDVEPKESQTVVPDYGPLVGVRPLTVDIPVSVMQGRDVRLQFQGKEKIMAEMANKAVPLTDVK